MKKFVIIFALLFLLLPIFKTIAAASNVGFVAGNIWYSKDPFEEGDKIRIYTLVWNGDKRELLGTVGFYDNDVLIDDKDFTISPETAKDIYINWTVKAGRHSITAKISNARFLVSSGKYENADLVDTESKESLRTVDVKIAPKTTESNQTKSNSDTSTSISNIEKTILDSTPVSISKPIISTIDTLDNFRSETSVAIDEKKAATRKEIDTLDAKLDTSSDAIPASSTTPNASTKQKPLKSGDAITFLKPFKYIELFFLTIFSFIFGSIYIFYIVLAILIFLILRYLWRRFF